MKKYLIWLVAMLLAPTLAQETTLMRIEKRDFGRTPDGTAVYQYVLTNRHGVEARVMTYGATWTHMKVPDRDGQLGDVLLGFDNLDRYLAGHPYFGSTAGRVANRIAHGEFSLDGKRYVLARNNGPNHLHGGLKALDKVVWQAEAVETDSGPAVRFTHTDPDGANGYPGNVELEVVYHLTDDDEMRIDYTATTDQATPLNLTNHAYFNLGTPSSGSVLDHLLQLNADAYTPVDDTLIPTGEIKKVEGTPFDFRSPTRIGDGVEEVGGYDHNFVLNDPSGELRWAARVTDPESGRSLEILTDQPGIQFYSGNFLDGSLTGKGNVIYRKHQGFCLETQHFPDAVNQPDFPSVILRPGQVYRTTTIVRFGVEN